MGEGGELWVRQLFGALAFFGLRIWEGYRLGLREWRVRAYSRSLKSYEHYSILFHIIPWDCMYSISCSMPRNTKLISKALILGLRLRVEVLGC